jgi:hypothetical protein
MFHTIEFVVDFTVDLEVSPRKPLEQIRVHQGMRRRAQIKPYVVETTQGPVEVADLFFDDGTTTRMVAFACFALVE